MNTIFTDQQFSRPASRWRSWKTAVFLLCVITAMTVIAFLHYVLFHSLIEFFSISIAFTVFIISWNSRQFIGHNSLSFLGFAYLAVGVLDLLHTLSYRGMAVFPNEYDYATQLWIAARYLESISLLFTFLLSRRRKLPYTPVLSVLALAFTLILLSIFYWRNFPACFIEGQGLTPFKIWSEYTISLILIISLFFLSRHRNQYEAVVYRLLVISIVLTIASELSFTLYSDRYGLFNQLGHHLKLASFYVIYKAIVETAIRKPYAVVFRDLLQQRKQLEEARSIAEKESRAKSEFLAHMSHEIRTPISGVIGMVDVITSRSRDPETQEYLSLIRESADSLLAVIGDILDLSQIESGIVDIQIEDWKIRNEVRALTAPLEMTAREKGLSFSLKIEDDVPEVVKTDGEKVAQILRNLISNAVKYTSSGSVTIGIGKEREAGEKTRLRFLVRDTGVGIPAEEQEVIFDSFVRLRKSVRERNAEGTGLGLSITRRLTSLLDSSITVESTPGEGSTFSFPLDVQTVQEHESRAVEPPASRLSEIPPLSILLVEDNRINRMFLEVTLRDAGHQVEVAEHGEEAIAMISRDGEKPFELVLMDVQMPVMDGIEATRAIRGMDGPASEVPIIALTAFALQGDEERFLQAGMNAYVTKPVDWDELARVVREVLC